ncbi:MAG: NAD(P)-dependent oxidoreductase [Bacteroidota bacterium]
MDVFFFEAFEEEEEALRHYLPDTIEAGFTWKTIQEYGADTPPAPMISLRTQSVIPLEWGDSLKAILSRSTGYDHLTKYRKDTGKDVDCGYLPLYCNRAVAEQAMLMWMALLRKFPQQLSNFRKFHRDGLTGRETEGKSLFVVGVGYIGYEVVKIGKGLGMEVKGHDLEHKYDDVDYVGIEEGLAQADITVCAMNLTEENRGVFTRELLEKAKPGMVFVNISRGELSPAVHLLPLVKSGHLAAVGLDAYNHEQELAVALREGRDSEDPEVHSILELLEMDQVICTPHNAFNTEEGVARKSSQSIDQVKEYQATGKFIWQVD